MTKPEFYFEIPVTVAVDETGRLVSAHIGDYDLNYVWNNEGDEINIEDTPIEDVLLGIENAITKALKIGDVLLEIGEALEKYK